MSASESQNWIGVNGRSKPENAPCGKYVLFVPAKDQDEVWSQIKSLTEKGILGNWSGIRTTPMVEQSHVGDYVIEIHCADSMKAGIEEELEDFLFAEYVECYIELVQTT